MASRLTVVWLCLCTACGSEATVRPAEVPKLERIERGESATLRLAGGGEVEISDYDEVRLYPPSGGAGYRLERPIRFMHAEGQLWLQSGAFAPIPFDPDRYSRAVVEYRDSGRSILIVCGAVLAGLVLFGTGELALGGKAAH